MPKIHARNASIYVDDTAGACQSISADLNTATLTFDAEAPDVTGFGNNTVQRLTQGLISWSLEVSGFYNTTATTAATCILFGLLSGSTFVQFGPSGSTSGSQKYTGCAVMTAFSQDYSTTEAITFSATFESRSGSLSASNW